MCMHAHTHTQRTAHANAHTHTPPVAMVMDSSSQAAALTAKADMMDHQSPTTTHQESEVTPDASLGLCERRPDRREGGGKATQESGRREALTG